MEDNESGDVCTVCQQAVTGGFDVFSGFQNDGTPTVVVEGTADRNFNVCDLCNDTVCFRCSLHPESGYCNPCFRKVFGDAGFVDSVGEAMKQ